MAGIEPASERLGPQTSTSVVGCSVAVWPTIDKGVRAAIRFVLSASNGVSHSTPALSRLFSSSRREGEADAAHKEPDNSVLAGLTRRAGELHTECFWHLFCARILRGRRLSARSSGPASIVEASHPRDEKL